MADKKDATNTSELTPPQGGTAPALPSEREKALERALRDGIVLVEDQALRLQRMGILSRAAGEWADEVRGLLR